MASPAYRIVGENPRGEAALISTGAPVPSGAYRIVLREQATARDALVDLPELHQRPYTLTVAHPRE